MERRAALPWIWRAAALNATAGGVLFLFGGGFGVLLLDGMLSYPESYSGREKLECAGLVAMSLGGVAQAVFGVLAMFSTTVRSRRFRVVVTGGTAASLFTALAGFWGLWFMVFGEYSGGTLMTPETTPAVGVAALSLIPIAVAAANVLAWRAALGHAGGSGGPIAAHE